MNSGRSKHHIQPDTEANQSHNAKLHVDSLRADPSTDPMPSCQPRGLWQMLGRFRQMSAEL